MNIGTKDTVGSRINSRMARIGMKQSELARESGLTKCNISLYVNDKRIPNSKGIIALAYALRCSSDYILGIRQ